MLGGFGWENLVGTSGLGFRNNIEKGERGAEGDFHNDALLGVKCGLSRLFVPGTVACIYCIDPLFPKPHYIH